MDETYAEVGTKVVLGKHIPKPYLVNPGLMNANWCSHMDTLVGKIATITGKSGKDGSGCLLCCVKENNWFWRVENMILASDIPLLTPEQKIKLRIR
jgi:hypothetical protein